jgi:hypothetical protein
MIPLFYKRLRVARWKMETESNRFMNTVLNRPDEIKQFLIEDGIHGKSISPISFFSEDEREKFLRKEHEVDE